MVFNTGPYTVLTDNSVLITAMMVVVVAEVCALLGDVWLKTYVA